MEHDFTKQARRFLAFGGVVALGFIVPLWELLRFSLKSDFFSYIPLVPCISAYFIHQQWSKLPRVASPAWFGTVVSALLGLGALGFYAWRVRFGEGLEYSTYLAVMTASFLLFLLGGVFYFFGASLVRSLAFPIGFMAFFIPPPAFLLDPTVNFFQYASAATAVAMIKLVGTPVLAGGVNLQLPGISLMVAPECSGIHSTMVLLMTSFIAGQMFLQSPWRRAILVCFVVPLAILRNGFRIFVIGELCVHIGPQMIDSPIHRHGGPLFFLLSLIPFFFLLIFLRKTELPEGASVLRTAQASPTL